MGDNARTCRQVKFKMHEDPNDIYALWDELAEFPVSRYDDALKHMLKRLCEIFGAKNALWSVVVRLPVPPDGDPLNGWRPRLVLPASQYP